MDKSVIIIMLAVVLYTEFYNENVFTVSYMIMIISQSARLLPAVLGMASSIVLAGVDLSSGVL